MPRPVIVKARFQRAYDRLGTAEQLRVKQALQSFQAYLDSGTAPVGFGLRKLAPGLYEFRAGLALRCVCVEHDEVLVLALLGSHDEIRQFLRRA